MNKVNILNIHITNLNVGEFLSIINQTIHDHSSLHIVTANAAMLTAALDDKELQEVLAQAGIVTADGMSIVWAAKFLGDPIQGRITGVDSILHICQEAQDKGHRIFFLGAQQDVIDKAVSVFKDKFPGLKVAGYHNGYFNDDTQIIQLINQARTDILFVGMGFSKQEKWIYRNKALLKVPVIMGVGGSFDVFAGRLKRAPVWMQNAGLEWLYRLLQEPGRLWKRYLISNVLFVFKVIEYKIFGHKKEKI